VYFPRNFCGVAAAGAVVMAHTNLSLSRRREMLSWLELDPLPVIDHQK
jgi:hypothetical protein